MADEQTTTTADGNTEQQQAAQTEGRVAEGQTTEAKADTIITGDNKAQTEQAQDTKVPATWPEDWRQKLAGDDSKMLERLNRFTDPSGVLKWATEAEKKINAGLLKRGLPEGASDDEKAAYRKEIGIPEKAEEYPLEPPKEVTITEADKPILDGFKKLAHELAVDPKTAQGIANWFLANRENELQDLSERADQSLQDRIVELRTEWGGDYSKNVTLANNFIAEVAGEKGPEIAGLMLADGTKLGSHPAFVRFAAQAARSYSSDTLHDGGEGSAGASVESRINDLKKLMGDSNSDYWKGPKRDELQNEYRNLIARRDRQKSRAA